MATVLGIIVSGHPGTTKAQNVNLKSDVHLHKRYVLSKEGGRYWSEMFSEFNSKLEPAAFFFQREENFHPLMHGWSRVSGHETLLKSVCLDSCLIDSRTADRPTMDCVLLLP
jgi:hypothetical protein